MSGTTDVESSKAKKITARGGAPVPVLKN